MKKFLTVIVVALLAVMPVRAQFANLSFGKYGVGGLGLKSGFWTATAWVMTHNKGENFVMKDISGTVYKNGKPFVTGSSAPVTVKAGDSKVTVDGKAKLCDGVSYWELLKCLAFDPDDYEIDVSMKVYVADTVRTVSKSHIPLKSMLHAAKR